MTKVTGKTLRYFQNSVEQAIISHNFDRAFDMLEATDSSTTSPGKESVSGRAKSSISFEAFLRAALGGEVATGTCVAGTKYLVTAGTVDGHDAGEIFTADGTEALSAENKVKPLGAKITGQTLAITFGGQTFKVTSVEYAVQYDELDGTDSSTAAPNKESVAGRAKITLKVDCIMYRDTADKITNAATASTAFVLTFASGLTVTGNAIFSQMSISGDVNGIVKVSYNADVQGIPAEVGIGYLTMATQESCDIRWETGSSTNKAVTGNVLLLGKTVSADVNSDVKISYQGVINGSITPAVYS